MARKCVIDTRGKLFEAVVRELREHNFAATHSRVTYPGPGRILWIENEKALSLIVIDERGARMPLIPGQDLLHINGVWYRTVWYPDALN